MATAWARLRAPSSLDDGVDDVLDGALGVGQVAGRCRRCCGHRPSGAGPPCPVRSDPPVGAGRSRSGPLRPRPTRLPRASSTGSGGAVAGRQLTDGVGQPLGAGLGTPDERPGSRRHCAVDTAAGQPVGDDQDPRRAGAAHGADGRVHLLAELVGGDDGDAGRVRPVLVGQGHVCAAPELGRDARPEYGVLGVDVDLAVLRSPVSATDDKPSGCRPPEWIGQDRPGGPSFANSRTSAGARSRSWTSLIICPFEMVAPDYKTGKVAAPPPRAQRHLRRSIGPPRYGVLKHYSRPQPDVCSTEDRPAGAGSGVERRGDRSAPVRRGAGRRRGHADALQPAQAPAPALRPAHGAPRPRRPRRARRRAGRGRGRRPRGRAGHQRRCSSRPRPAC